MTLDTTNAVADCIILLQWVRWRHARVAVCSAWRRSKYTDNFPFVDGCVALVITCLLFITAYFKTIIRVEAALKSSQVYHQTYPLSKNNSPSDWIIRNRSFLLFFFREKNDVWCVNHCSKNKNTIHLRIYFDVYWIIHSTCQQHRNIAFAPQLNSIVSYTRQKYVWKSVRQTSRPPARVAASYFLRLQLWRQTSHHTSSGWKRIKMCAGGPKNLPPHVAATEEIGPAATFALIFVT